MYDRSDAFKEVAMFDRLRLVGVLILVAIAAYVAASGCAMMGPKRAPLMSLPDSLDVDSKAEALEAFAVQYPEDAEVFFALGNVYYDQAVPDLARQNYEKAISLDPKMTKARVNLATLIGESGEADSARVMLEEIIRDDPSDPRALTNLGMLLYNQKDVDTAVKYFNKALILDPTSPEARYNLGLAFAEQGLLLEAIREWRAVLELTDEGDTANRARLALERVEGSLSK
jgi:cytochrome c-type biogenesis protein CcmH/NrfG